MSRTFVFFAVLTANAIGWAKAPTSAPSPATAPPVVAAQHASARPALRTHRAPPVVAINAATGLPRNMRRVTEVEGITEYQLTNGLQVLLMPDASKPTVTVNVTYRVGSRHENYGETGMAHLLEHLVFKGTPKFPKIDREFNARGARWNGTTWFDRTNYFELMQATDDNLRWAIEMEADRMVNSFIAQKDLDSEMTVVRNEYEAGENQPVDVMLKRMHSVAFDWHSYGRDTIGNKSDIENVRIENLQAFYRTYYQPDNATVIIAGKFDEAKVRGWIAQYFGAIPKPKRSLPPFWTTEPTQDGERSFYVRRKGEMQVVMLGYKVPSAVHPHNARLALAEYALSDTPTGRLHKALVETGKAAQVFGYSPDTLYPGLQLFAAIVKKGEPLEPVRDEMIRVIEGFDRTPLTEEELNRAKKAYANQFEKSLNDHERIGIELSEYIALGDWRLFFADRDALAQVKTEDGTAAARAYFQRDNRTVGFYVPEDTPRRADIPRTPNVADVMKDFSPKASSGRSEAFDPSPENIERRTTRKTIGGMRVALLPKQNRGESVHVRINLNYGDEKSLAGKRAVWELMNGMLTRGTSRLTRSQISDAMDKLKMEGSILGYQTTRTHLVASLELVAHILKDASFPAAEFEQLVKQYVTHYESQKSEPDARAWEAINQHFNHYPITDPRYSPTLDDAIAEVQRTSLDAVKAFHRTLMGADHGEIAIVGDFDAGQAQAAIATHFGTWKSGAPHARLIYTHADIAPTQRWIHTPDKESATFMARINVELRQEDPDFLPLALANYIMGGGAGLNSRLSERIRQKEGLSYGIGSTLSVRQLDRAGSWTVSGIAAPQNIAKVEAAFFDELRKALNDGFTPAEIDRARTGTLQLRVQQRAQDRSLASALAANLYLDRTFMVAQAEDERIQSLTKAEIDAAFRKYIIPSRLTVIKAGDKTKADAAASAANLKPADQR